MIRLKETEPFGVGGRRLCFAHPDNPDRCVKVLRTDEDRAIRLKRFSLIPAWARRVYDNNAHERIELGKIEKRAGAAMSRHFPRCHGVVQTDLGPGLELDLVRDHDGKISRSLRELLSNGHRLESFREAFDAFGEFLYEQVILTRNLLDHNLVAQDHGNGTWTIKLIDGMGDPAWLPLARWFRFFGRRKVGKRLAVAWARLQRFAAQGGITEEKVKNSTWGHGFLKHR